MLLAPAAAARAATHNVTNSADSGQGSFRQALSLAGTGDTITFSTAGPIMLSSPLIVGSGVQIEGCADVNVIAPCVTIQAAGGSDALDVTGSGATIGGLRITGAAIGIHVSASDVTVGGFSPGSQNEIDNSSGPAIAVDAGASGVMISRNTGHGNGGPFVQLAPGANGGVQPPTILAASASEVAGMAAPGALVTVFAVPASGSVASFDGAVTADQTGLWELPAAADAGELVAAAQTEPAGTSALSASTSAAGATAAAPPTATIAGPSGTIYTASPTFTVASSDPGATILCRLDSSPYSVCGASDSVAALREGAHTLAVRALDDAGLGPVLNDTFDVDLAQPGTIVSGPPRYGRKSYATFSFTVASSTVATACALDDQRFEACHGRFATGYILDGRHVFHLQTTDAAGQSVVLDTVFTVDTLPLRSRSQARTRASAPTGRCRSRFSARPVSQAAAWARSCSRRCRPASRSGRERLDRRAGRQARAPSIRSRSRCRCGP